MLQFLGPSDYSIIITAVVVFAATNIDDIIILVLFFSETNQSFRRQHIVLGQYLGFLPLVGISLVGFVGGLVVPRQWIGMLGVIPILIGTRKLLRSGLDSSSKTLDDDQSPRRSKLNALLNPNTWNVAAVTLANGGDNIGIYTPLFAGMNLSALFLTVATFLVLIALWLIVGSMLTNQPLIAENLTRHGRRVMPFVLIGLGVIILVESGTLLLFLSYYC
ncbi:MAG: cadmium resistance transporter [Candidatus Thorarchaeota archaeon]|nr:cadmium resistance transporter [Candidatus Thorarchaeota archaeon]